jgi:hypothetical protein
MPERNRKAHAIEVQQALAREAEGRRVRLVRAREYNANTYVAPLPERGATRYVVIRAGSGQAIHELRYGEERS